LDVDDLIGWMAPLSESGTFRTYIVLDTHSGEQRDTSVLLALTWTLSVQVAFGFGAILIWLFLMERF